LPIDGRCRMAVDGSLVVNLDDGREEGRARGKRFTLVDPQRGPGNVRAMQGEWLLTEDGLHAYRVTHTDRSLRFEAMSLQSGKSTGELQLDGNLYSNSDNDVAVSSYGTLLAVVKGTWPRSDIEIYDVASARLIGRAGAPSVEDETEEGYASMPSFLPGDGEIQYSWHSGHGGGPMVHCRAPLKIAMRSKHFRSTRVGTLPVQTPGDGLTPYLLDADKQGRMAYGAAPSDRRPGLWLWISDGEAVLAPWRQYPNPLYGTRTWKDPFGGRGALEIGAPSAFLVPRRDALVVVVVEPTIVDSLPAAVAKTVPTNSTLRGRGRTISWYGWDTGEWLRIANLSSLVDLQPRPTSLLTLVRDGDSLILQSWPLPPRDPKPPALAIAALCMAGTWWVCAWRYRRMMRLAV